MLWYIAYGSNLLPDNLARYMNGDAKDVTPLFHIPYERYFAGESYRWDGGVAFLSVFTSSRRSPARGYLVTDQQFDTILNGENGVSGMRGAYHVPALGTGQRQVHDIPEFHDDPHKGKYNAVLRLKDIDGIPSATITSSRNLPRRKPSPEYTEAIARGELWLPCAE